MAQNIRDLMVSDPVCLPADSTVTSAAMAMRDEGIGDVIVHEDGQIFGIVTDRDLTVRVAARGWSPTAVMIGEICSRKVVALLPMDSVTDAVTLMRFNALRRVPLLDGDHPIGIVSLGDLALRRDPDSALASISGPPPNF